MNRIPDKERLFYELKKIMISYGESDRFCRVAAGKEKIKERAKIAFRSSIIVQYSRNKDIERYRTSRNSVFCYRIGKAMAVPALYGAYGVTD